MERKHSRKKENCTYKLQEKGRCSQHGQKLCVVTQDRPGGLHTWQGQIMERHAHQTKVTGFYPARSKEPQMWSNKASTRSDLWWMGWMNVRLGHRRLFEKLCNSPHEWTAHGTAAGGVGRERTGQISEAKTQWPGDQPGWAWVRGKKAKMMPWLLTWEGIRLQAKPSVSV